MGMFGSDLLANDDALDWLDALEAAPDAAALLIETLASVDRFYARKRAGHAPRLQTEAERNAMVESMEQGMLDANLHVSAEEVIRFVEDFRQFSESAEPILIDTGQEEIAKACAAVSVMVAAHSANQPMKLANAAKKLKVHGIALPIHRASVVIHQILGSTELAHLFGAAYTAKVKRLADELALLQQGA